MATSTRIGGTNPTAAQPRSADGKYAEWNRGKADTSSLDTLTATRATEAPEGPDAAGATTRAFPDTNEVFTTRYDSVEDKIAAFKSELDKAVADLDTDENWKNYLDTMSRFHRYSWTNQMLIALQTGGRATRVAGFQAWKTKFGRSVNKGEKAITIFAPRLITAKDKDGSPLLDANGKPIKKAIGFTTTSVFDVSQTSGEPLPEVDVELSETPPEGFVEDMTKAAEAAGYSVEFRAMDSHAQGSAQGWTDPKAKRIVIDASLTEGSQAATLAHELGHVYAGHCDPENEGKYHVGNGGCRGRYETEAESVAYTLCRANGMSTDQAKLSGQYVAGWSRHDKDGLKESAEAVSKATKRILESTAFRNLSDA